MICRSLLLIMFYHFTTHIVVSKYRRCFTDYPVCFILGDCCGDTLESHRVIHISPNLTIYSCRQFPMIRRPILTIDACPINANATYKALCARRITGEYTFHYIHPVVAGQAVFHNKYCTQCHNVTRFSVVDMRAKCVNKTRDVTTKDVQLGRCRLLYIGLEQHDVRKCFNLTSTCLVRKPSHPLVSACTTATTEYYVCPNTKDKTIYRNRDCAVCNNNACIPMRVPPNWLDFPYNSISDASMSPSFLFRIRFNERPPKKSSNSTKLKVKVRTTVRRDAIRYVVFVASALSIVALICLLAFFAMSKQRRTFPSLLTCSMLVSLTMLLSVTVVVNCISTAHIAVCYQIARILHASYLPTFGWLLMMAVDMTHKFRSLSVVHSDKKRYTLYTSFVLVFMCSIITISSVIDKARPNSILAPRYGMNVCWISNPYAIVVWFVVPIGSIILYNLAAVCYLTWLMSRTTISHRNGQNHENFVTLLKITVILGVPWIGTIASAYIDSYAIEMISTIINYLQGVLLLICYTCNASRRRMFVRTFFCRKKSNTRSNKTNEVHLSEGSSKTT